MPLFFLACVALLMVSETISNHLASMSRAFWVDQVLLLVALVPRTVLLSAAAVAIHRFILLGETRPGGAMVPAVLRFTGWTLLLQLAMILAYGAALALPEQQLSFAQKMVTLGYLVLVPWIVLLFPGVAVDEPAASVLDRLKIAIRRARGNFWWITRAMILTMLPLFLGLLVIVFVGNMITGRPPSGAPLPATTLLTYLSIGAAAVILIPALAAAAASWLYRFATQHVNQDTP